MQHKIIFIILECIFFTLVFILLWEYLIHKGLDPFFYTILGPLLMAVDVSPTNKTQGVGIVVLLVILGNSYLVRENLFTGLMTVFCLAIWWIIGVASTGIDA